MIVGIVGLGHWGKNLLRTFNELGFGVIYYDVEAREAPNSVSSLDKLIRRSDLIVISTPTNTHYNICKTALEYGKHVFCEKPLDTVSERAHELYCIAAQNNRTLFVDNTYLYNNRVIQYVHTIRANESDVVHLDIDWYNKYLPRTDVNVAWDLAYHAICIADYLTLHKKIVNVNAGGLRKRGNDLPHDFVVLSIEYEGGITLYGKFSWLDAEKTRRINVLTESGYNYVFDEIKQEIRAFNDKCEQYSCYRFAKTNPLKRACEKFIECVEKGVLTPQKEISLKAVETLETCQRILEF